MTFGKVLSRRAPNAIFVDGCRVLDLDSRRFEILGDDLVHVDYIYLPMTTEGPPADALHRSSKRVG